MSGLLRSGNRDSGFGELHLLGPRRDSKSCMREDVTRERFGV